MSSRSPLPALLASALTAALAASPQPPADRRFDDEFARLRRGPAYSADVARGVVQRSHRSGAVEFPYTVQVPASYEPTRKYQVRVHLHGGVGRPQPAVRGDGSIGALAGEEQIYVMPVAWEAEPWWKITQIESLRGILNSLKDTYNIDENRVALSGVSDGGTGAYYVAMHDTTPYASFLPLNGYIMVLANRSLRLREQLFPHNLRNKPFFVVNGGRDQLYPTSIVEPSIRHLQQGGVGIAYRPQPNGLHNTAWWPDVRDEFENFVRDHPRDPYPRVLTWETESTPARAHWLVIDSLAAPGADEPLPDVNERVAGSSPNFGVRADGMRITTVLKGSNAERFGLLPGDLVESINGRVLPPAVALLDMLEVYEPGTKLAFMVGRAGRSIELSGIFEPLRLPNVITMFPRTGPSGRVDLVRDGNTVRASTRGVAAFTLLVSPDVFDFARPITVIANGRTVFSGRVEKSVATLSKWASLDRDRTMLFGAEVRVLLR